MTRILQGDCLEVLRTLTEQSFDGCLCDPPYGLEFMGVAWDTFNRPQGTPRTRNEWGDFGSREHARKPSERARVSRKKALKFQEFSAAWAAAVLRVLKPGAFLLAFGGTRTYHRLACAIEDAGFEIRDCIMWMYGSGFPKHGSCLKPAWEPILVARKSGKGVLNIDACRIASGPIRKNTAGGLGYASENGITPGTGTHMQTLGRWPANVILDEEAGAALDQQSGIAPGDGRPRSFRRTKQTTGWSGGSFPAPLSGVDRNDSGGASRFFYCAKASRKERGEGNTHPTVKPLKLTEYLARLILPAHGGRLIVPFAGSGSEMIGAKRAGWNEVLGIELNPAYIGMSRARLSTLPVVKESASQPTAGRLLKKAIAA